MDKFCLWNGEGEAPGRSRTAQGAEVVLEQLNIASVRGGRDSDHEIVHVGKHDTLGDLGVQGRNVNDEKKGRNGRALGGTNRNR